MIPGTLILFNDLSFLDNDVLSRNVLVKAFAAGFYAFDLIDDVAAFNDLAKHSVAPAVGRGRREIQKVVVSDVDEELRRGGVGVIGARHGNGVAVVLQTVIGFIFDRVARGLLLHSGLKTATLNHEVIDDPMENRAIKEAFLHIAEKIFNGFGRFFSIQLQDNIAFIRLKLDARRVVHDGITLLCSG